MIKVIVEYKVKKGEDIQPILLKQRSHAITYPGFVGAESLINNKDSSIVVVVGTWEKIEDWRAWEESRIRQELLREAKAILEEERRATTYRMMSTARWVG